MDRLFNYNPPPDMYDTLVKFSEYPKPPEGCKDRVLLQELGTDWARNYDSDVWVRGIQDRIKEGNKYVITDCRFPNEFDAFHIDGWNSVYVSTHPVLRKVRIISRDGAWDDSWTDHPSEKYIPSLAEKCDIIMHNDGTKEQLAYSVNNMIKDIDPDMRLKLEYRIYLPH